jgi:4-amino-4-deoxy-L-arabinose transferase-like glycosyltransferase
MSTSSLKRPPAGWTLVGLLALYALAGLFGHDPWKTEDVVHLAVARDFLDAGHGLGLSLAGRPFLAAPLYYWSAALTYFGFGWLMPMHDALRLASGLWTALTLIILYYAGREWHGRENAAAAPILLAGSFGLIVCAHEAQPMLVLLVALSLWLLAIALLPRKPRMGALFLAGALVLGALGMGLAGLLPLLILTALSLCFYRSRPALRAVLLALALGALALAAAGGALRALAPEWFAAWLRHERVALLVGDWRYGRDMLEFLKLLPWFSWPLWPLAGWTLWQKRRQWKNVEILAPLVVFAVLFFVLPICVYIKESTAMLILPPLALLAAPGALILRRGAANALDWFSGMAFSIFALLLWTGWSAMVFGYPARLAQRAVALEPGFVGRFDIWLFALAVLTTLWWGWLLLKLPPSPWRCIIRWSAGLLIGWLLAVSLWLPWIDYGKSYRQTAAALAAQLPKDAGCIAEWRLGDAQRASFAYFERLRFTPLKAEGQHCRWLLTQGNARAELTPPGHGWRRVWEGHRSGDRKERFRLYRRSTDPQ